MIKAMYEELQEVISTLRNLKNFDMNIIIDACIKLDRISDSLDCFETITIYKLREAKDE